MPNSCCEVEHVEFCRAGHAGALRPHDAVAAGQVPRSWSIQQRRPCEVAKKRSMDLRDKRHSDHLLGAACKQPRANYGWFGPGIHTYKPTLHGAAAPAASSRRVSSARRLHRQLRTPSCAPGRHKGRASAHQARADVLGSSSKVVDRKRMSSAADESASPAHRKAMSQWRLLGTT